MPSRTGRSTILVVSTLSLVVATTGRSQLQLHQTPLSVGPPNEHVASQSIVEPHEERTHDPYMPGQGQVAGGAKSAPAVVQRGPYVSIQVNVDANGQNIIGDAANEPSIAVSPTAPANMVIAWRQFDATASNFRQAGIAYTLDSGQIWTFPGVLDPGVFRSDPVLAADADGTFYYNSLTVNGDYFCTIFKSTDGGMHFDQGVYALGGDKLWMDIDRTGGIGHGHLYAAWDYAGCCGDNWSTRSRDGALTFDDPIPILGQPIWGVTAVGPDGEVYVAGRSYTSSAQIVVAKSSTLRDPAAPLAFDFSRIVDLGGSHRYYTGVGPNPGGLMGQVWVATDPTEGPGRGHVYTLCSVDPPGADPADVMFARSTDGGLNWSPPIRVNDDPSDNGAWQWFGTMSVAPNGRIDVVWNDTRDTESFAHSELYYAFSNNGGLTWSANTPLSPSFNSLVGWPNQDKLGDYYDMISDNAGVNVAYAATFNGEQDVYFLRIGDRDCNGNERPDTEDVATLFSKDCNENRAPDECERDCNNSGYPDSCDLVDGSSEDCNTNLVPDECDPDFDHDGTTDDCDSDRDGDGAENALDICPFTPLGLAVNATGRPIGDSGDCIISLLDVVRLPICLRGPAIPQPDSYCSRLYDFPHASQPADLDVDLWDFAEFQKAFMGE